MVKRKVLNLIIIFTMIFSLTGFPKEAFAGMITNWTQVGNSSLYDDVAYGDNCYIAISYDGNVYKSIDDGNTWVMKTNLGGNPGYIAFGNGKFIVTDTSVGSENVFVSSDDGESWSSIQIGTTGGSLAGITYGDDGFVAVGSWSSSKASIYKSIDGVTWTMPFFNIDPDGIGGMVFNNVGYGNGIYVAVGGNGRLYSSSDASTWTLRTAPNSYYYMGVAYGNNTFVAVSDHGTLITSSDNGATWSGSVGYTAANGLNNIKFGNGYFYAVGSGGIIIKSSDGSNWTEDTSGTTMDLYGIACGNGNFIAAATDFGSTGVLLKGEISNVISDITAASITGITSPAAGVSPVTAGAITAGAGTYTVTKLTWENGDGSAVTLTSEGKFKAASTYKAEIELTSATGNKFQAGGLTPSAISGTAGTGMVSGGDTEGNKLTFTVTFPATAAKTVSSIAVKTQPTKLTYTEGENLDLSGLVSTLTYNDGSTADIALSQFGVNGITTSPVDETAMVITTHNGHAVTLSCNGHDATTGSLTVNAPLPVYISAAAVSITAPAAGVTPVTAAAIEVATSNADYTVSNVVWNEALTTGNKFKAGQVYTATVTLTSKNGKEFQAGAFTPTVAGSASVGTTTTTGTGTGNTVNFTVTFSATAAKTVSSIAVKTQPTKLTYTEGESLDLTGLVSTLTYNDGSTADIALAQFGGNGITTNPADGTAMVIATHNGHGITLSCNGHSVATGSLTVNAPLPVYISAAAVSITALAAGASPVTAGAIEAATSNADYTVSNVVWNEALTTGNKFKAGQAYTATVTLTSKNGKEFQAGAFTPTVAGSASVGTTTTTGTGTGNTVSFTVTFSATAAKAVSSIAVKTQPTKLTYTEGESLDLTGLVSTLTYNDGSTADIALAQFGVNGITTNPADETAMVAATHNGHGVTLSCNGHSVATNSLTVNTEVSGAAPTAPSGLAAAAGNSKVTLNWNGISSATGYKIYKSTTPGSYGSALEAVTGSVYSYDAVNLTNGLTYYFVITAVNSDGESQKSSEVSAVPRTVPGAPSNVNATAGNGAATVSFTAPDNGGSPVASYIVTSNPGSITGTGTSSPITVTGLTNGISYTFTVKAVNAAGGGEDSLASNSVTPSGGGGSSSGNPAPTSTSTPTPVPTPMPAPNEQPEKSGVEILVNGKVETAATATTTKVDNKTVISVIVDDKKVEEKLQKEGNNSVVTIPVKNDADVVVGQLSGQTVKNMENKEAVLEIKTDNITYTLPASQINIDNVSSQIGSQVELKDIKVNVKIADSSPETANIVHDTAKRNSYQVVVKPVDFDISCTSGSKTVEVSKFNGYVERLVAIPDGIDPSKITTGIVLNKDGTFSHVPTNITKIDQKYYAKINSLTNSTYSVIWSPKTFKDVENHWAKDAVNDMGSRLVIGGVSDNAFEPDRDITRAEFASIVVKALGLMRPGSGKDVFSDVAKDAWYYDAVSTAHEYGIISGYENGKFMPMDKITREQAMAMTARAMKITKLKAELNSDEQEKILSLYNDSEKAADWAKESMASCIKSEIITGRDGKLTAPKDNIVRAEVAVIVKRLLQKSKLI